MSTSTPKMLLQVKDLCVTYGKAVDALIGVTFEIEQDEIVALIGPNGAGKSTTLKAITGLLGVQDGKITRGDIYYKGSSIIGMKPHQLLRLGISLVPEGRRVFPSMNVEENLLMGGFTLHSIKKRNLELVNELFPILAERRKQKAGSLSAGEQQMLALGRALMLNPTLLILDEPTLGLSPNFVNVVVEKIIEINKKGTTVMLVEQNVEAARRCATRLIRIVNGKIEDSDKKATRKVKWL